VHPSIAIDLATGAPKCCNCKHWLGVGQQAKAKCAKHGIDTLDLTRCSAWGASGDVEIKVKTGARST